MTRSRGPHLRVEARVRSRFGARSCRLLQSRTRRAALAMGITGEALDEVVVQVCTSKSMAALNEEFRGVRSSTDVLSFPAPEGDGRGDLALDWAYVQRQALAAGRSVDDEAAILVVHGLAHLLGHDHHGRAEGRRMLRWERRGLRAIRVVDSPRPYGGA